MLSYAGTVNCLKYSRIAPEGHSSGNERGPQAAQNFKRILLRHRKRKLIARKSPARSLSLSAVPRQGFEGCARERERDVFGSPVLPPEPRSLPPRLSV